MPVYVVPVVKKNGKLPVEAPSEGEAMEYVETLTDEEIDTDTDWTYMEIECDLSQLSVEE